VAAIGGAGGGGRAGDGGSVRRLRALPRERAVLVRVRAGRVRLLGGGAHAAAADLWMGRAARLRALDQAARRRAAAAGADRRSPGARRRADPGARGVARRAGGGGGGAAVARLGGGEVRPRAPRLVPLAQRARALDGDAAAPDARHVLPARAVALRRSAGADHRRRGPRLAGGRA